jgi:DNA-binding NarL/FixJ family response regulator
VPDIAVGLAVQEDAVGRRIADALSEGGLALIARAASAEQIVAASAVRCAVVVLAGPASTSRGAADIRLVLERLPGAEVVVVSSEPRGRGVRKALTAGAAGFVFEYELAATLAITVRAVAAGQVAIPRQLVHHVDKPALSPREKQILGMVVLGFQNQEIAAKLHLAETTVKSHLSSTFKKLDVGSRKEAAALVLDHREGLGSGILSMPGAERLPDVERGE